MTTEDIETRLQSLRTRQQEAARRYAQAEAKIDTVKARRAEILASLKEHGFDSPEEARAEVENLSSQVEATLEKIEEKVRGL